MNIHEKIDSKTPKVGKEELNNRRINNHGTS